MSATVKLLLSAFLIFLYIDSCKSANLTVGTNVNGKLAYTENVHLKAVPFTSRKKNCFYNGNATITGIYATDLSKTNSTAKVTAGGVGFTFTNVKLKGEKWEELKYKIEIYVS